MAIQYYSLEEAARLLNVSPEELKLMCRRGKPRPFKDGGTFQFRVTEIDEMARELGLRSDPELSMREGRVGAKRRTSEVRRAASEEATIPPPMEPRKRTSGLKQASAEEKTVPPPTKKKTSDVKPGRSEEATIPPPSGPPRRKPSEVRQSRAEETTIPPPSGPTRRKSELKPPKADEGVFDFDLGTDEGAVDLGQKDAGDKGKSGKSGKHVGPSSGSDSDVRLVPDGSEIDFEVASDSDPRMVESAPPKRKSGVQKPAQRDSGVRLVPESPSDSDVKLVQDSGQAEAVNLDAPKSKTASDSDVRLEKLPGGTAPRGKDKRSKVQLTEEIDLDAELDDSDQKRSMKPPSSPVLPTESPFELKGAKDADDGLIPLIPDDVELESAGGAQAKRGAEKVSKDSSGEFELSLEGSDLEKSKPAPPGSSGELELAMDDGSPVPKPE